MTMADKINAALAEGAIIYAHTHAATMRITKRYAGMFSMDSRGNVVLKVPGARSVTFLTGSTAWRY